MDKRVRRRKQLALREDDRLPAVLRRVRDFSFPRSMLNRFQKNVYDRFSIRSAVRALWKDKRNRPVLRNLGIRRGEFVRLLAGEVFRQGGALPPFLLPVFDFNGAQLCSGLFYAECENVGGTNAYYFGVDLVLGGVVKAVWWSSHAVDRLGERLGLLRTEGDVGCWLNIVRGTKMGVWREAKFGGVDFLTVSWPLPFPPNKVGEPLVDDLIVAFPIVDMVIRGEPGVLLSTALLPGMSPVPQSKLDRQGVIDMWRQRWDGTVTCGVKVVSVGEYEVMCEQGRR